MNPLSLAFLIPGISSAVAQIFGSQAAASAQTDAAGQATAAQLAMFGITQSNLAPFIGYGTNTGNAQLPAAMGAATTPTPTMDPTTQASLMAPVNMNQATLEQTPGYQWALGQGEKSTTNALAARGLAGGSGAQIKGAEQFATGLASQTYQQQFANAIANKQMTLGTFQQNFNNQLTNKQTALNAAMGLTTLGANAASGLTTAATTTGSGIAANTIGAGQAQATSDIQAANAVTGAGNAFSTSQLVGTPSGLAALNALVAPRT